MVDGESAPSFSGIDNIEQKYGGLAVATYDGLLMRDNLEDTGVVPSPGYPYHSPDIIAHSQVEKPDTFLKLTMIQTLMRPLKLGAGLT